MCSSDLGAPGAAIRRGVVARRMTGSVSLSRLLTLSWNVTVVLRSQTNRVRYRSPEPSSSVLFPRSGLAPSSLPVATPPSRTS